MRDDLIQHYPGFKLILTTPDFFFKSKDFRDLLSDYHKNNLISFVVIDEAHLINLWGFGFKNEYRQLDLIKSMFKDIQIIAMTATDRKSVV